MNKNLGEYLKSVREEKGLELEDLAKETKIQKRYLRALEEEDYEELPGEAYVKGFLKNYAQALGMSLSEVSDLYVKENIAEDKISEKDEDIQKNLMVRNVKIAIVLLILFYGVTAILAGRKINRNENINVEKDNSVIEVKEESLERVEKKDPEEKKIIKSKIDDVASHRSDLKIVKLTVIGKSWILVRIGDEKVFEGIVDKTSKNLEYQSRGEKIYLKIGDASQVKITYNGKEEDILGGKKVVVEKVY